jgi:predicted O-methyltransferase YrrM
MPDSGAPPALHDIQREAEQLGFDASSEPLTGQLLRVLAASKPGGRMLEIGTGAGIGTCWLLDGMDAASTLITIDQNAAVSAIAQKYLGANRRATFIVGNADDFLKHPPATQFDLIFADSFPGKYYLLDEALSLLVPGGLYVIDDLLPQTNWPDGHQANVDRLVAHLQVREDLRVVRLDWASGIMICVKR